jgi:hypothetical protein
MPSIGRPARPNLARRRRRRPPHASQARHGSTSRDAAPGAPRHPQVDRRGRACPPLGLVCGRARRVGRRCGPARAHAADRSAVGVARREGAPPASAAASAQGLDAVAAPGRTRTIPRPPARDPMGSTCPDDPPRQADLVAEQPIWSRGSRRERGLTSARHAAPTSLASRSHLWGSARRAASAPGEEPARIREGWSSGAPDTRRSSSSSHGRVVMPR